MNRIREGNRRKRRTHPGYQPRAVGLRDLPGTEPRTVYLQPQPDDTLPRFEYEDHLAHLLGRDPSWPEGTRRISELRLSFRCNATNNSGIQYRSKRLDAKPDAPNRWRVRGSNGWCWSTGMAATLQRGLPRSPRSMQSARVRRRRHP